MMVSASIYEDYTFRPNSAESWDFARVMGDLVVPKSDGFTLSAYRRIPDLVVQGQTYFNLPRLAEKTRVFKTKSALLYSLGGCISLHKAAPVSFFGGLKLPDGYTLKPMVTGIQANHIPQMFSVNQDNGLLVIGVNGWYDFQSKKFEGQIIFSAEKDLPR